MKLTFRRGLSLLIEAAIAVIVPVAWLSMALSVDENGMLTGRGLWSLRYFTTLSNLLAGAASLACVVGLLRRLRSGAPLPRWCMTLRLVGATGVTLTFLTVVLFLGPLFGYGSMYVGANFWFHLTVPLLSFGGYLLLDGEPITAKDTLFSLVPIGLYAVYYLGTLLLVGFLIFFVLLAVIWLSGFLLWKLWSRMHRNETAKEKGTV